MDDVADVDLTHAGHAIDRRGQAGVAELDLGRFDQRLVGLDRRSAAAPPAPVWVSTSCGVAQPLLAELGVATEIGLGVCKLGLIAIARGGHLIDLRLIGPRIDLCEQIARMHGLPFGEVDLGDLSLDLAAHERRCCRRSRYRRRADRSARPGC